MDSPPHDLSGGEWEMMGIPGEFLVWLLSIWLTSVLLDANTGVFARTSSSCVRRGRMWSRTARSALPADREVGRRETEEQLGRLGEKVCFFSFHFTVFSPTLATSSVLSPGHTVCDHTRIQFSRLKTCRMLLLCYL